MEDAAGGYGSQRNGISSHYSHHFTPLKATLGPVISIRREHVNHNGEHQPVQLRERETVGVEESKEERKKGNKWVNAAVL